MDRPQSLKASRLMQAGRPAGRQGHWEARGGKESKKKTTNKATVLFLCLSLEIKTKIGAYNIF